MNQTAGVSHGSGRRLNDHHDRHQPHWNDTAHPIRNKTTVFPNETEHAGTAWSKPVDHGVSKADNDHHDGSGF